MTATPSQRIEMIPIDRITIINPRVRNSRVFNEIVENIDKIGLKRPITVSRHAGDGDVPGYDLVCGQGRLEACKALGQDIVPALIVTADEEDCLVSSLVENCARRQHRAPDLLQDIGGMKARGYSSADIATKTGLSHEYVLGVLHLLEAGEQRLLSAVESGLIPISVAVTIAQAEDRDVQAALQDASEKGDLKGRKLIEVRRLVERRRRRGKDFRGSTSRPRDLSAEGLVRAYEEDAERKRALIKRSEIAKARLALVVGAVRMLVTDDALVVLLDEEGLSTLPGNLADRVASGDDEADEP
jgi:ParB family chromosome partitioning protein